MNDAGWSEQLDSIITWLFSLNFFCTCTVTKGSSTDTFWLDTGHHTKQSCELISQEENQRRKEVLRR